MSQRQMKYHFSNIGVSNLVCDRILCRTYYKSLQSRIIKLFKIVLTSQTISTLRMPNPAIFPIFILTPYDSQNQHRTDATPIKNLPPRIPMNENTSPPSCSQNHSHASHSHTKRSVQYSCYANLGFHSTFKYAGASPDNKMTQFIIGPKDGGYIHVTNPGHVRSENRREHESRTFVPNFSC